MNNNGEMYGSHRIERARRRAWKAHQKRHLDKQFAVSMGIVFAIDVASALLYDANVLSYSTCDTLVWCITISYMLMAIFWFGAKYSELERQ